MAHSLLYDAVTLRHFAAAEELDLLCNLHNALPLPRWTQAVAHEISRGAARGEEDCMAVQGCVWLGTPYESSDLTDLVGIQQLRVALSQPGDLRGHIGEAETLYVAEKLAASIATDDAAAYEFAARRLGSGRTFDTIDFLHEAVERGVRTAQEAAAIAARISDGGRHLRYVHPAYPGADYFQ